MSEPRLLPGCGEIGSIESMVVDGKRWWFGFHFRADVVTTTPCDDPEAMIAFAEREQPGEPWRDWVLAATEGSELGTAPMELAPIHDALATIERTNQPIAKLTLPAGFGYLLGASTEWQGSTAVSPASITLLKKAGLAKVQLADVFDDKNALACLRGKGKYMGLTPTEVARLFRERIAVYLKSAPAGWADVFAPLAGGATAKKTTAKKKTAKKKAAKKKAAKKKTAKKKRARRP